MWRLKEKESSTETVVPRTGQALSPPDSAPLPASSTVVNPAAEGDLRGQVQTRFGTSIKFNGEMTGSEDVYVAGEIEGTVDLGDKALIVGPSGNVRSQVKARSITVSGHLEGKVHAGERIEIRETGSLEGDLVTSRIVVEDGAVFRGAIDVLKPEMNEKAPPAAAAEPGPPSVSTADSTDNSGS